MFLFIAISRHHKLSSALKDVSTGYSMWSYPIWMLVALSTMAKLLQMNRALKKQPVSEYVLAKGYMVYKFQKALGTA